MKDKSIRRHTDNSVTLTVLGKVYTASQLDDGYRTAGMKHNNEVDKNRQLCVTSKEEKHS